MAVQRVGPGRRCHPPSQRPTTLSRHRSASGIGRRYPSFRFCEVILVEFKADKPPDAAALRRDRRIPDAKKWIEHCLDARDAVEFDAPFSELHWERGRMRTFLRAILNSFVGDEPGVSATTQIAAARMRPACDIGFVLIGNAEREPFDRRLALSRKVKNIFVAIVEKTT